MVILDTNVPSELMQQRANPLVQQWLDHQSELSV
jgi:predicted nucleic acid-binding protein